MWPSKLRNNLNPIKEIIEDGLIDPKEFDGELGNLSDKDRNELMAAILSYPFINSIV